MQWLYASELLDLHFSDSQLHNSRIRHINIWMLCGTVHSSPTLYADNVYYSQRFHGHCNFVVCHILPVILMSDPWPAILEVHAYLNCLLLQFVWLWLPPLLLSWRTSRVSLTVSSCWFAPVTISSPSTKCIRKFSHRWTENGCMQPVRMEPVTTGTKIVTSQSESNNW